MVVEKSQSILSLKMDEAKIDEKAMTKTKRYERFPGRGIKTNMLQRMLNVEQMIIKVNSTFGDLKRLQHIAKEKADIKRDDLSLDTSSRRW